LGCTEKSFEHFQPSYLTQRYDLIQTLLDEFIIEPLCSVLGVSRTAYYRYQRGERYLPTPEKEANQTLVEEVFREHKRRYGSRRTVSELKDQGYQLDRRQVRSLIASTALLYRAPSVACTDEFLPNGSKTALTYL